MSEDNNTNNCVIYDTENSIIFEDYFDLILNKNNTFHDVQCTNHKNDYQKNDNQKSNNHKLVFGTSSIVWENATKLEQYEFIQYSQYSKSKHLIPRKPQYGDPVYTGGLQLPKQEKSSCTENGVKQRKSAGSGNILILGNPGAGKSTLAIQIAAACASKVNKGISVYYSLEVDPKDMISNMFHSKLYKSEEEHIKLKPWFYLPGNEDDELSSENLCKRLRKVLSGDPEDSKIEPQILFPSMTPRGLGGFSNDHRLFVDRYTELKHMAKAIKKYNENAVITGEPLIKIVVIDSINAFSDCPLTREELYRLFDLFRQYGILGIFTLENNEFSREYKNQFTSETAKYMSDVVISLDKGIYNDYTCLYLEVEKSRYVTQVIGKHPYKITGLDPKDNDLNLRKHIEIIPSLHYRIFASEAKPTNPSQADNLSHNKNDKAPKGNIFGIDALNNILPNHFKTRNKNTPQIITIIGTSGIYKSDLAFNAVLNGMLVENPDECENGLLIRLNDRSIFSTSGMRLNVKIIDRLNELKEKEESKNYVRTDQEENKTKITLYEKKLPVRRSNTEHKYSTKGWSFKKDGDFQLIEIAFKSGALLPEEFIEEVCRIIKQFKIKRVAFSDIKAIGVSYPFLINSKTSGSIFLSAFIHIMRNYGVHVVMSCSSSGYDQSDNELHKACILSDAVITMKRNETEHIIIEGEGTVTSHQKITIGLTIPANPEDIKTTNNSVEDGIKSNCDDTNNVTASETKSDKDTANSPNNELKYHDEYYFYFEQVNDESQSESFGTNPLLPFICDEETKAERKSYLLK
jgi:KaiC/GvpD/RAD55 family RecA-like ATPase